jgi:RNA polymerase sigma factor (sigma-70 family)
VPSYVRVLNPSSQGGGSQHQGRRKKKQFHRPIRCRSGAIMGGERDMTPTSPQRPAGEAPAPDPASAGWAALSDDQLVELFRRNHSADIGALIAARHGQMVFRTCFRRLGNVHDAEDATQAVFLAFVQRPDRVKPPLGAWLHEVARQTVHNLIRGRTRQRLREEAKMRANPADRAAVPADLGEELDVALARLPAQLRGAVIARYLQAQPVNEAARAAGCDPSTFGRRCDRGLDRLRAILAERGTVVGSAALIGFMSQEASAAVPAATLTAIQVATTGIGAVSAQATLLSHQVLTAMFWAKVKLVAAILATATATVATGAVVVPLVMPAKAPATRAEPAREVLLRLDFEDGKLPAFCRTGRIVKGPEREGNRFCLEGQPPPGATHRMFLQKDEGLFTYGDDVALVFDLWVDAQIATVDLNMWDRTQQANYGLVEPLRVPREQWVEGVVVRLADFKYGPQKVRPKPGDTITNLSIQAGQMGGTIYIDNLEIVRAADLQPSLGKTRKK